MELACRGYRGVDDVLERDVGGFCTAVADNVNLTLLTSGLGDNLETRKVELKPYVSSRPNHTAIDATRELRRDHPDVDPKSITKIEIEVGTPKDNSGAGFPVTDVPSALTSVAYCAAVALLDDAAFLDQFTEKRMQDPTLRVLLDRTRVQCNPEIDARGLEERDHTVVKWHLANGRTLQKTKTYAKGHPTNPLTEAEGRAKFHQLADSVVGATRAKDIEDGGANLNKSDVGRLSRLLALEAL